MYKLMLVEDEDLVRNGIASLVDWESCGFTLCSMAAGGLEAIESAGKTLPDVVLTDIAMPYMNGIEMIERLRGLYPLMQYIIVSGHDDFSFVQSALRNRVLDYLLKPLAREGIMEVLRRAKAQLDEQSDNRLNLSLLEARAKENLLLSERMAVYELLTGSADSQEPGAAQVKALFPCFLALLSRAPEPAKGPRPAFQGREDLLSASMMGIIQDGCAPLNGFCLRFRGQYLALLRGSQEEAVAAMDQIQAELKHYLDLNLDVSIASEVFSAKDLAPAYRQALLRLLSSGLGEKGRLYLSDESPPPQPARSAERLFRQLGELIRLGDDEGLRGFFREQTEALLAALPDATELQFHYAAIQSAVLSTASWAGIEEARVFPFLPYDPLSDPLDVPLFMGRLCELALGVSRLIAAQNKRDDKALLDRILAFIHENYRSHELSLELLCSRFHISGTQFFLLFKREMGTSFLQYVLDLRIKTAQKMLLESDEKIYRIAELCGFGDAAYFGYCFKQRCGLTPKDFRKR
ncbi:MAG: response regulator [Christensenellaceae bacterium]|jgi:two-component system response regulator YesN|nr:response regulator [Christensenellaceae bacterium]